MIKVFVYGTLRSGQGNNVLLAESEFLGEYVTPPEYRMLDLGGFPAVVPGGDTAITGEVYAITPGVFKALDTLEGFPDLYRRRLVVTDYGQAWMYYMESAIHCTHRIANGDWCKPVRAEVEGVGYGRSYGC